MNIKFKYLILLLSLFLFFIGLWWLLIPIILGILVNYLLRHYKFFIWLQKYKWFTNSITLIGIFFVTILFRICIVEIFTIPSGSMENTLLPGDKIIVNKLVYGPCMPDSPYDIPWVNLIWLLKMNASTNIDSSYWGYHRLNGFSQIKKGDVMVFVNPIVKMKTNIFVKRCVALPGDTLIIKNGQVKINGQLQSNPDMSKYAYPIKADNIGQERWVYPKDSMFQWTIDNYGPLVIPKKGMTIPLNRYYYLLYERTIRKIEQQEIKQKNSQYYIKDSLITHYTFRHDYYFMMGDNRNNTVDSREWGFIPEDNIVGKAGLVLFSNNKERIKWNRLLKKIK